MAGMNGSCVVKPAAWDSLAKGSFSCRGLQVVEQGLSKKGLYLFQLCVAERPHLRLPFRGKRTAVFDLPLKEPRDQVAAFYSPLSTSSTQPPLMAPGPREALAFNLSLLAGPKLTVSTKSNALYSCSSIPPALAFSVLSPLPHLRVCALLLLTQAVHRQPTP
jgi:hypothetical protein